MAPSGGQDGRVGAERWRDMDAAPARQENRLATGDSPLAPPAPGPTQHVIYGDAAYSSRNLDACRQKGRVEPRIIQDKLDRGRQGDDQDTERLRGTSLPEEAARRRAWVGWIAQRRGKTRHWKARVGYNTGQTVEFVISAFKKLWRASQRHSGRTIREVRLRIAVQQMEGRGAC